ncbi:MAG: STAS domain-containing protein [Pseudomonadales bacterium]|jgi:anti-anti-sigma regulatory factor|nr:STAS domain-containing protein [Pseudomonadales bacterium]
MSSGKILAADYKHMAMLKFVGDVRVLMSSTLDGYCNSLYRRGILDAMVVDLSETRGIDSTALGLLAKMAIQLLNRFNVTPTIISTNADITKILHRMSFDKIFNIVDKPPPPPEQPSACASINKPLPLKPAGYTELKQNTENESTLRDKVLDAHITLMALSEQNKLEFQDLVQALRSQGF